MTVWYYYYYIIVIIIIIIVWFWLSPTPVKGYFCQLFAACFLERGYANLLSVIRGKSP